MKYISLKTALVALLAVGLIAACVSPAFADDAAATYKAKCALCHGPDGKGSAMGQKMGVRDFGSAEVKAETDAQLVDVITKGKGKMPPYTGKVKDTEIKDLVTYIRSLTK
jgi:cytochrome c6